MQKVLFATLLLGTAGCAEQPADEPESGPVENPFAGQTVEVVVPSGLAARDRWQVLLDEWSAQTGGQCRIAEYSLDGDGGLPTKWFGTAARRTETERPRILVFPLTRLAHLVDRNVLERIPPDQQSDGNLDWLDLFQGLREKVASVEGQPAVLPISSPVLVCYYRRDLLEEAGLSPPRTWEEYQDLLKTLEQWAPGMTAVEPWGEDHRTTLFLARAVSRAQHPDYFSLFFDMDSGKPLINTPGFVRALEAAREAVAAMPAAVREYTPRDCRREFLAGRAALAVTFETGAENAPLPFGPGRRGATRADGSPADSAAKAPQRRLESGAIGFCRLPGSPSAYNAGTGNWNPARGGLNRVSLSGFGGLAAGVSPGRNGNGTEAAWNLLRTLAVENLRAAFPGGTKSPCRRSHLAMPTIWVGRDLGSGEAESYLDAVAASLEDTRLVAELPVVGRQRFRRALSQGLTEVLWGDAEAQEALDGVAARWTSITGELGKGRLIDSYRRSLGLMPRIDLDESRRPAQAR